MSLPTKSGRLALDEVRRQILAYCEGLRDHGAGYGCFRRARGERPDLYASVDIAIMRGVMGEDLERLPHRDREAWIAHINSFADGYHHDGRYGDVHRGHSPLHANGMVIGALGLLGGRQPLPLRLYEPFLTIDGAKAWLEVFDWPRQWAESHGFWGGLLCHSFSRACTDGWRASVVSWLDDNLDEATGWWRKRLEPADRNQPLGGAAHVVPLYQHHHRSFPYPERVIDSVIALQLPDGTWRGDPDRPPLSYLELDALYMYKTMQIWAPTHRKDDILTSVQRLANVAVDYWNERRADLFDRHPHEVLAVAGVLGLIQHFLPDRFTDDRVWSDIFSDRRLYRTDLVERLDR